VISYYSNKKLIRERRKSLKDFFKRVYLVVSKIPEGKVATYGQIARLLGEPRSARIVGWAMKAAPSELHLPCHRVVNRLGELAPEYAFGSKQLQRDILETEGITFKKDGSINLNKHLWNGDEFYKYMLKSTK
jgi:methylated-DNA-protein-cysteine methyltransferase related protein